VNQLQNRSNRRISELKGNLFENTQAEKKRRIKRNEENSWELWDSIQRPNILVIGIQEDLRMPEG
jgi:hypothetical protein